MKKKEQIIDKKLFYSLLILCFVIGLILGIAVSMALADKFDLILILSALVASFGAMFFNVILISQMTILLQKIAGNTTPLVTEKELIIDEKQIRFDDEDDEDDDRF